MSPLELGMFHLWVKKMPRSLVGSPEPTGQCQGADTNEDNKVNEQTMRQVRPSNAQLTAP